MTGQQKRSYLLLGILQDHAPNGAAQEKCSEVYREAQVDLTEDQLEATMAELISDGLRHGNWPWIEVGKS